MFRKVICAANVYKCYGNRNCAQLHASFQIPAIKLTFMQKINQALPKYWPVKFTNPALNFSA